MKLPNAVSAEPHVDARDRRRNFEVIRVNLSRPTTVLDTLGSKIEGSPKLRHAIDVGWRRILECRLVACKARVLGPRVGYAVGSVTLTAPSAGWSGSPKVAARAAAADNAPPVAVVRTSRLDSIPFAPFKIALEKLWSVVA
jgi:hypothetical protein